MSKKRMKLSVDEDIYQYINAYMEEHQISFVGDAISRICIEHKKQKETKFSIAYVTEIVSNQMKEVFEKELNRVRLASNSSDKNTQVILELLNGIFFLEGYNNIISTNDQEAEGLKTARQVVQDRISHSRQKKIDYEARKGVQ